MPFKREERQRTKDSNTSNGLMMVGVFLIIVGIFGFILVEAEYHQLSELPEDFKELDWVDIAIAYQVLLQLALIASGAAFIKIGKQENIWSEHEGGSN